MMPQLAYRLAGGTATTKPTDADLADATEDVLSADPLDLVLYGDQLWELATPAPAVGDREPALEGHPGAPGRQPTASMRSQRRRTGMPWDHFGYSFCIDNTRAPQILLRVLKGFRSGEGLGIPSAATQRWLDATEVLLAGAINPMAAWLSTSAVRPSAEAVRRNAYWRVFSMDLSFGTDANAPFVYDKAEATNRTFPQLFEELLFELWRAIENIKNLVGANSTDNDRIFRLAEQLSYILRFRRQNGVLDREELSRLAGDGLGRADPRVQHPSRARPARRGNQPRRPPAHHRRTRRAGSRTARPAPSCRWPASSRSCCGPWRPTRCAAPTTRRSSTRMTKPAIGKESLRVLTEWSAATGRDLKV